jgi:hypothetical protein
MVGVVRREERWPHREMTGSQNRELVVAHGSRIQIRTWLNYRVFRRQVKVGDIVVTPDG